MNNEDFKRAIKSYNARLRQKQYPSTRHAELRLKVLQHYCQSEIPYCMCPGCDVTMLEFLALDHINGDGNQHRKEVGGRGRAVYQWIVRNDYPDGFQVLCHNCNSAKGYYGTCPHGTRQPLIEIALTIEG